LTLVYLALPDDIRTIASGTPRAFVKKAERVLSDREKGIKPSGWALMTPVTDSALRAALDLLPEDEAEAKLRGLVGILRTKDQLRQN
jgi:hypothetical protein